MLVLRGLYTLLVGYSVLILGSPSRASPNSRIQLARADPSDWNESGVEPVPEGGNGQPVVRRGVPPRPIRLHEGQTADWTPGDQTGKRLRARDNEVPTLSQPVQEDNGTGPLCPGCGTSTQGVSTIFVTSTRTSTVTVFVGPPITSVVLVTATESLTFVNPTLGTQTSTVTVTSFFRLVRRTRLPGPQHTTVRFPQSIEKRAEATTTSTITTIITSTRTTQSTVFATRTNTIFVTITVGPNASTTVFTTTTIFTTSPTTPTTTPTSTSSPASTTTTSPTAVPPTSSTSGPPSSSTSTTSTSTSSTSTTSASTSTSDTMISMMTSSPMSTVTSTSSGGGPGPTTSPPVPTSTGVPPSALPSSALNADQIAGIVLGSVGGILLILLGILALRWCIRRRRRRLAQMRQQLSSTSMGVGATAATAAMARGHSPPGSATSGLTGEGEVRIVIRPARSQLWPMPPGHGGPTYSFFVEDTTTGQTTPARERDPTTWSNASDSGSVRRVIPRKPILSASGPGTRTASSSGDTGSASVGPRSVPRTSGVGTASGPMRDAAGNSLVSIGWGTSLGGRSSFSATGVNTKLSPPPPAHGNGSSAGEGSEGRQGTGYPGSWGIGKAI